MNRRSPENLVRQIDCALGRESADLVLRNVCIFHLSTGEMEEGDIAIRDGTISAIGHGFSGVREYDGRGLTAVPGFVDAHLHVESTLSVPGEYEKVILPHGVTTAVCDPHELANVIGTEAFQFFYESAQGMSMDLRVHLSSCVPSTDLETAGASVCAEELLQFQTLHPEAGLAEFMNFPGVLAKEPEVLRKLSAFSLIDGHAPMLTGKELCAYCAAGIGNDHEVSSVEEGMEKIRRGMAVFLRDGSVARDLQNLYPLLTLENSPFLAFCTDDLNFLDVRERRHIDGMIARAIAAGVPPLVAYRVASLSPATMLGLRDRGLLAPGRRADIVLVSSLEKCQVEAVFCQGRLVGPERFQTKTADVSRYTHTVRRSKVSAADFIVHSGSSSTPVIGIRSMSLITDRLDRKLPLRDGVKEPLPAEDILRLAVLERHGKNGSIGLGFVHGFGLKKGAIASSVGHDSHNLCVVGVTKEDMAVAVNALIDSQGGFVVVSEGKVEEILPLPVAGLMSDRPSTEVLEHLMAVRAAARATGCPLAEPFLQLAFLPLPVIPYLKLTDQGLVSVSDFQIIPT